MDLESRILGFLSAGHAMTALAIAKACELVRKKDVNPTLYKMTREGTLSMDATTLPPCFQLRVMGTIAQPAVQAELSATAGIERDAQTHISPPREARPPGTYVAGWHIPARQASTTPMHAASIAPEVPQPVPTGAIKKESHPLPSHVQSYEEGSADDNEAATAQLQELLDHLKAEISELHENASRGSEAPGDDDEGIECKTDGDVPRKRFRGS